MLVYNIECASMCKKIEHFTQKTVAIVETTATHTHTHVQLSGLKKVNNKAKRNGKQRSEEITTTPAANSRK